MWTTSVANRAASESWSASLTATIASMPSSRQARTIRTAISPRLATSTRRMRVADFTTTTRTERSRTGASLLDRHAVLDADGDDLAADACLDVGHQLHHLDDAHRRRRVDDVADVGERWCTRLRRAPEDARRRRHDDVRAGRQRGRRCRRRPVGRGSVRIAAGTVGCRPSDVVDVAGGAAGADVEAGEWKARRSTRWTRTSPERTSISDQSDRSNASTTRLIASSELLTMVLFRTCVCHAAQPEVILRLGARC